MKIKPFKATRYNPKKVELKKVVAPPYDVISAARQDELYELSPYNIVRLILGKEHPSDNQTDNRYTRAGIDYEQWLNEGVLQKDQKQAFYIYEQTFCWNDKTYVRTGVMARVELKELGDGIFPHEKTMNKAKEDRYRLTEACKANFSPIFSLYESAEEMNELLLHLKKSEPEVNIVDDRGVGDKLWVISDEEQIKRLRSNLEGNDIFIADGHHRYETALRFHKNHPEMPEAKYVLMMLIEMSDKGLVVLPAHRVVALGFKTAEGFLDDLKLDFEVEPVEPELDGALARLEKDDNNFILVIKGYYYKIRFKKEELSDENDFEVSILHKFILDKILNIKNSKVEDQVFFTKSPEEAVKLASAPQTAAFLLRPTPLEALKKVARARQTMPQKSTYFYPKLLSGLVVNSLED